MLMIGSLHYSQSLQHGWRQLFGTWPTLEEMAICFGDVWWANCHWWFILWSIVISNCHLFISVYQASVSANMSSQIWVWYRSSDFVHTKSNSLRAQTMTSHSVQSILQVQSPVLAGFEYQSLVAGSLVKLAWLVNINEYHIAMAYMLSIAQCISVPTFLHKIQTRVSQAEPAPRGVVEANGSWCCHHATEHPATGWEQSRQGYLFSFLTATDTPRCHGISDSCRNM